MCCQSAFKTQQTLRPLIAAGNDTLDDAVAPGATHTYIWQVGLAAHCSHHARMLGGAALHSVQRDPLCSSPTRLPSCQ